jgi:hypothetical protein
VQYSDWQRDNGPFLAEISLHFFDETHLPLRLDTPSSSTPPTFPRLHPPSSSITLTPLRPHPPSFDPTHLPSTSPTFPQPTHLPLPPLHLAIMSVTNSTFRAHTPPSRWLDGAQSPLQQPGLGSYGVAPKFWCAAPKPSRVAMATPGSHPPTFLRPHSPSVDPNHLSPRSSFGLTHLASTTSTFHVDHTHLPVRSHPLFLRALLSPAISQQLYACGIWHSPALKRLSQVTFPSHIRVYTKNWLTPPDRPMTHPHLQIAWVASQLHCLSLSSIFLLHL